MREALWLHFARVA